MKVKVTNKRPVTVVIAGLSFRPRASSELEVDARRLRQIQSRYGLVVEELVEVAPTAWPPEGRHFTGSSPDATAADEVICPDCGRPFRSAFGLQSHQRAKHQKES